MVQNFFVKNDAFFKIWGKITSNPHPPRIFFLRNGNIYFVDLRSNFDLSLQGQNANFEKTPLHLQTCSQGHASLLCYFFHIGPPGSEQ